MRTCAAAIEEQHRLQTERDDLARLAGELIEALADQDNASERASAAAAGLAEVLARSDG